ncbi:Cytochrome c-type biogenesis protein ccmH precursor (Cytochrome c-type biogenesis protein cycL) [Bartonella clarridgeiae 73]|uniref:Cytochrome c-type biogenesis protein n=1 Tax=Bartonella clarridgeiae (strain CCUG 45776 / CIP 104772 / 73) TaxID=696125 RepID=E6YGT3_BARC7|nr:cytochrome c-type biogenesis protein [Bartonella clarridgeiae]WCR55337.1 MAG: Cytochrome c heme lyase subunit CcmL [Bartonella clarridgeiae]CBI76071.1 Cytochrome c-type biogenesis protein ccmH precursor (Cytochrome c-type biogenesis protein cycL) [Bartonella clarridgeiae 73]
MRRLFFWTFTFFVLIFSMQLVRGVEPDEILMDSVLEARARDISSYLRCPVCQNQSIDDSDTSSARDLRLLVRERLKAGDNDQQVINFLVERYGEFILLTPPFNKMTWLLWLSPLIIIIIGLGFILFRIRWISRKTFITFDANE